MSTSNTSGHLYEPRKSNLGGLRRRDTLKRRQPPVVKDQEIRPSEASQEEGMASGAASQRQFLEQSGHALIENGLVVPAGLLTKRGGQPPFADAGWPHEDQIVVPLDPDANGQLLIQ